MAKLPANPLTATVFLLLAIVLEKTHLIVNYHSVSVGLFLIIALQENRCETDQLSVKLCHLDRLDKLHRLV